MESEYYDVHYLTYHKVIVTGVDFFGAVVEVELSDEQREYLMNFEQSQQSARKRFLKGLIES